MEGLAKSLLRSKATGSGADRWLNCPASVAMELSLVEPEKKYAETGTRAHKIAAIALATDMPLDKIVGEDLDMTDAIKVYVGTVRDIAGPGEFIVETRLPLLGSSGGIDCYAIRGRNCFLFDLKYGVGVKVYADENGQLAFYACAIREKHPEVKVVQAYLIQPRVEGLFEDSASITSWTIPYQTMAMWRRRFEEGLAEVEKAQGLKAGEHCQFCKAKGGCPAHVVYAETAASEQSAFPNELIPAPGDKWLPDIVPRVARLLLMEGPVKAYFAKAQEFLLMVAKSSPAGKQLLLENGFELAQKRSNRKWKHELGLQEDDLFPDSDPPTEESTAQALIDRGISEPYEKSLMPLTRAEKLGVDVDDLVFKPKGGDKLVPIEKGKQRKSLPSQTN